MTELAPQQQSKALAKVGERTITNGAARIVILGDLSGLSEEAQSKYYIEVCRSLDLNPLTRPFSYLKLNGKTVLYANRDATDQLRKRDRASISIVARERLDEMIVVTARAMLPDGRTDEALGAVPCGANVKGEALANAMMKAETKAKRRVTLSICGLGFMDESEIEGAKAEGEDPPRISQHVMPGDDQNAAPLPSEKHDRIMVALKAIDARIHKPGTILWSDLVELQKQVGRKGEQSPLGKEISDLYQGSEIVPIQREAMMKLWARIKRKVDKLADEIPPPSVEASFVDDEPEREPGDDTDEL